MHSAVGRAGCSAGCIMQGVVQGVLCRVYSAGSSGEV